MSGWFDNLRRLLGWKSNPTPTPIVFSVDAVQIYAPGAEAVEIYAPGAEAVEIYS